VGDVNVETLLGKAATWVQWAATNLGGGLGFWVLLAIALGVVAAAILSTLGDLIKAFLATHTGTLLGLGLPALIAAGSVVGFDDQVTNVAVWLPAIVGFAVGGAWAASTYLKRWSRWQRHAAWAFGGIGERVTDRPTDRRGRGRSDAGRRERTAPGARCRRALLSHLQ
jgi:hypothetical protein